MKTMVEFGHRLTSGFSLILVTALVYFSRKYFPKDHPARRGAWWAFGFILGEAAVGAMLVLLALVGGNDSSLRAVVIAFHLVNTFLLLYWLVFVAVTASQVELKESMEGRHRPASGSRRPLLICMTLYGLVGATGAVVALGDTLFPSTSLAHGLQADLAAGAHFLVRLRVLHPLIAVLSLGYIVMQMLGLPKLYPDQVNKQHAAWVTGLLLFQFAGGVLNLLLLAPVWMQLFHLLMADIVWIALARVYVDSRFSISKPQKGFQ
jgi:cytochrome c oxidase assembly protein subunit 15